MELVHVQLEVQADQEKTTRRNVCAARRDNRSCCAQKDHLGVQGGTSVGRMQAQVCSEAS